MKELTLEQFNEIPYGAIFAKGVLPNSPEGIFMTRDGGNLKWIAKKGHANDWAIYCHWEYKTDEFVEKSGDKLHNKEHIQLCVPCSDEVFNSYRH